MSIVATVNRFFKTQRLIGYAKDLNSDCQKSSSLEELIDTVLSSKKFSLVQKRPEILKLVELVKDLKPKVICDIGSSGGGTVRLFSQCADSSTRILSVDINNTSLRQQSFPHLLKDEQKITVFQGSSYAPETIAYLKDWLKGEKIDLLFIDGDHSYHGVSQDYILYSPFVRAGGIIGFHDIVADFKTRFGIETPAYVGEVPKFWQELKKQGLKTQEFIENVDQDGFGIGVIFKL